MVHRLIGLLTTIMFFLIVPFVSLIAEDNDSNSSTDFYVPEGYVGVVRHGGEFYNEIYETGLYSLSPSEEGFVINMTPHQEHVSDIACITVDGEFIAFPKIIIHFQTSEEFALSLVTHYGVNFQVPLIRLPVRQGVSDFCSVMTAEEVYLDRFSIIQHRLATYLTDFQLEKESGLTIDTVEIISPLHSRKAIDNFIVPSEMPYEIFYTLESESEARKRLCALDNQCSGQKSNLYLTESQNKQGSYVLPLSIRETKAPVAITEKVLCDKDSAETLLLFQNQKIPWHLKAQKPTGCWNYLHGRLYLTW